MTAKEMFKKLGYKQQINDDYLLQYYLKKESYFIKIGFNKFAKNIGIYGGYAISKPNDKDWLISYTTDIDLKLLQAINKQVEELGWNNV